jgi:hypothetical protein
MEIVIGGGLLLCGGYHIVQPFSGPPAPEPPRAICFIGGATGSPATPLVCNAAAGRLSSIILKFLKISLDKILNVLLYLGNDRKLVTWEII